MSRNYLDSYQFRLDDQAFCERMDRDLARRANNPSDEDASAGNPAPAESHPLDMDAHSQMGEGS